MPSLRGQGVARAVEQGRASVWCGKESNLQDILSLKQERTDIPLSPMNGICSCAADIEYHGYPICRALVDLPIYETLCKAAVLTYALRTSPLPPK